MFKTLLATTLVGSALATDVVLEDFSNPYVVCVVSLLKREDGRPFGHTCRFEERINSLFLQTHIQP